MSRVDKLNELFKEEIADLISREIYIDNALITVSYVSCTGDLNYAKVGISVLPDKFSGTALKILRSHTSQFAGILKKKLKIRKIPKINWAFDSTEKDAAKIEKYIDEVVKEK